MTWKQTFTGRQFYSLAPRAEDIDIRDIAKSLANTCRYRGHTKCHHSIAQHSVLVARYAKAEDALRALLHDAHEAYSPFGDVARPDKDAIKEDEPLVAAYIDKVEERIDREIAKAFGLPYPICNDAIKVLDTRILHDERAAYMTPTDHPWDVPFEPLGIEMEQWGPQRSEWEFLNAFDLYYHGSGA